MRIVIIGCGKIGGKLAGVLSEEGHDVVAVDASEEVTSRLSDRYDGNEPAGQRSDAGRPA